MNIKSWNSTAHTSGHTQLCEAGGSNEDRRQTTLQLIVTKGPEFDIAHSRANMAFVPVRADAKRSLEMYKEFKLPITDPGST